MAKLGRIALDFGTSAIKLIQIGGKAGAPKIDKIDLSPIIQAQGNEGSDVFPKDAVLAALKDLLSRNKIKVKKVAITIPGQAAIIRLIKIPNASKEKISQMIRFEAEPLIPVPLDQCAFGHKIISMGEDGSTAKVLFVAVKNEWIQNYVDVLKEMKMIPELIEVSSISSATAFKNAVAGENEAVALIDFGAGSTDISVIRNGEIEFTRSAAVAGGSFAQALQSKLEISRDEAERIKREKVKLSAVQAARPSGTAPGMRGPGQGIPQLPGIPSTTRPGGAIPPPMGGPSPMGGAAIPKPSGAPMPAPGAGPMGAKAPAPPMAPPPLAPGA